jgi:outer membrane protein assembly factor BamB
VPKRLWKRDIGFGHSSILVDGGGQRLYTMYRSGDDKVVISLDANTGQTLWEFRYPAPFLSGMNMDVGPGPHATALLVGGRLYATGVTGKLHCLDARTGKLRWKRGLLEEMGGTVMVRGYSASPIAYRDTVIVTVGGPGHALAALDQKTGAVVWTRQDFKNSHASPILIRLDGQEQLVAVMDKIIIGVDPATGELLWSHPHDTIGDMTATTPVWSDGNLLFVSSAYNGGMVPVAKSGPPILASRVGLLRASGWSHELLLSGLSISLAMVI